MIFGKEKERIRQWGLLGILLRDTPLVSALGFMAEAFGDSPVRWEVVQDSVSRGSPLSELAAAMEMPEAVVDATIKGEKDGRLPDRLADLAPSRATGNFREGEGMVSLIDQIILQAAEKGHAEVLLTAPRNGNFRVMAGDEQITEMPANVADAIRRRLTVMTGRPYWSKSEEAGVCKVASPKGKIEVRVTLVRDGSIRLQLSKA